MTAYDQVRHYDLIMNEVSNRMASSKLTRRPSHNSASNNVRPTRIEKPRSNHSSPNFANRRRTFSTARNYTPLGDFFDIPQGISSAPGPQPSMDHRTAHRPLSWHPSATLNTSHNHQYTSAPCQLQQAPRNAQNGDMWMSNGAIMPDEGYTSSYAAQDDEDVVRNGAFFSPNQYSPNNNQPMTSGYLLPLAQPRYAQPQGYGSWNSSYTSLPTQRPEVTPEPELSRQASTELVGMGLYDPPELDSGWGQQRGSGKGLKLEDAWEPPSAEDDGESSDDDEVEEPPPPPAPVAVPQPRTTPHTSHQYPSNMMGQSFLDDDTAKNEWWYRQLKQPQRQYSNLGYDWL